MLWLFFLWVFDSQSHSIDSKEVHYPGREAACLKSNVMFCVVPVGDSILVQKNHKFFSPESRKVFFEVVSSITE